MNILFVCTGNTCRSPVAEAILRSSTSLPIQIQSAGTQATPDASMSPHAQAVLQERSIAIAHAAQRVNVELLTWADLILTMTRPQKILLAASAPDFADKIHTLKGYGGDTDHPDIEDPIGTDLDSYRQCADEIAEACDRLQQKLTRVIQSS